MITEATLKSFFARQCRLIAVRTRVPSPRPHFSRYVHHDTWHVCPHEQHLIFDSAEWIEVSW